MAAGSRSPRLAWLGLAGGILVVGLAALSLVGRLTGERGAPLVPDTRPERASAATSEPLPAAAAPDPRAAARETVAEVAAAEEAAPTALDMEASAEPRPLAVRGRLLRGGEELAETQVPVNVTPLAVLGRGLEPERVRWPDRPHYLERIEASIDPETGLLFTPSPGGYRFAARTDEAGAFELVLPPEARPFGARLRFALGSWRREHAAVRELIDLSALDDEVDLGNIELVMDSTLHRLVAAGRVIDADGRPAPGAEVRIMGGREFEDEGRRRIGYSDFLRVHADEHGRFEASGVVLDGEATHGLSISATAPGHASGFVRGPALGARDVVVQLGRAGALEGRVELTGGHPLPPGLQAQLVWQRERGERPFDQSRSAQRAEVAPDGSFSFDAVSPQYLYGLRLSLRDRALPARELEVTDLEVRPGEVLRDPRLQPLDVTRHVVVHELRFESEGGAPLGEVSVSTGFLTTGLAPEHARMLRKPVGTFDGPARWLELHGGPAPIQAELTAPGHESLLIVLDEHTPVRTVRLAPLPPPEAENDSER